MIKFLIGPKLECWREFVILIKITPLVLFKLKDKLKSDKNYELIYTVEREWISKFFYAKRYGMETMIMIRLFGKRVHKMNHQIPINKHESNK